MRPAGSVGGINTVAKPVAYPVKISSKEAWLLHNGKLDCVDSDGCANTDPGIKPAISKVIIRFFIYTSKKIILVIKINYLISIDFVKLQVQSPVLQGKPRMLGQTIY
jgi:hypothetical protein